jgi:hypothetical protein
MRRRRKRWQDQQGAQAKRPPKTRLLVDESISGTESVLRTRYHLAVIGARPGDTDAANIQRAGSEGLIFVTPDHGQPRRIPLDKSPGILVISGSLQQSTESAAALIGTFFREYRSAGLASGTPQPQQRLTLRWESGQPAGTLESLTADSQPVAVRFRIPRRKRQRR